MFFSVLLNALIAITEINNLYSQRPIVEKQASYAFYHPFTEALAGIVSDIPVKFIIAVCFNIVIYFLSGLRREPAQFFIFFLFNFVALLTVSEPGVETGTWLTYPDEHDLPNYRGKYKVSLAGVSHCRRRSPRYSYLYRIHYPKTSNASMVHVDFVDKSRGIRF